MARKRARLGEDNDPLTSTDKVLAGFEELSKSTSQEVDKSGSQKDMEASKTNKSTSRQVKKSTRQPANKSTIRASRRKKTSSSNTSKQGTQLLSKSTSQQDKNIESQEVYHSKDYDKLTSQQDEKIENQEVAEKLDIVPTSEQSNKSESQLLSNKGSQQDDKDIGNEVSDEINSKPTSQEVNKSPSQQVKNKESQELKQNQNSNDKLASQQANKLVVRKSTFQLSSKILEQLDRLHLELQLELGKVNAPYKEVIVEEAIGRLLEVAGDNRSELVEAFLERQSQRK